MTKRSRLVIKYPVQISNGKKNGGQAFKIRTQIVSERRPFEIRIVQISDVHCITIIICIGSSCIRLVVYIVLGKLELRAIFWPNTIWLVQWTPNYWISQVVKWSGFLKPLEVQIKNNPTIENRTKKEWQSIVIWTKIIQMMIWTLTWLIFRYPVPPVNVYFHRLDNDHLMTYYLKRFEKRTSIKKTRNNSYWGVFHRTQDKMFYLVNKFWRHGCCCTLHK